jgi:drug/metabolite transporter (DMT)-like permease
MNYLPFALLAYLLNALAVTIDKFLLTKHIPNPLGYIFYTSVASLLALGLFPWTTTPPLAALILASVSTLLWTSGAYLMFHALKLGLASSVIPLIGTLIPLILLLHGIFYQSLDSSQIGAVSILILGMVVLSSTDFKSNLKPKQLSLIFFSALLFAVSYLVLKEAYLRADFLSVLVYSRLVLIPLILLTLLIPLTRNIVLVKDKAQPKFNFLSKAGALYGVGMLFGGLSEILITYSISLASPALVNSLQGVQYAFLFLLSLTLAKKFPIIYQEKYTPAYLIFKTLGVILIGVGLYLLADVT